MLLFKRDCIDLILRPCKGADDVDYFVLIYIKP